MDLNHYCFILPKFYYPFGQYLLKLTVARDCTLNFLDQTAFKPSQQGVLGQIYPDKDHAGLLGFCTP